MIKKLKLHTGIYGEWITFLIGKDKKEMIDYISKNQPKGYSDSWIDNINTMYSEWNDEGQCFVSFLEDCEHYIIMKRKPNKITHLGGVNHEILHVVSRILYKRGLKLCPETEEAYTYFQQYIFDEFCRGFKITLQNKV